MPVRAGKRRGSALEKALAVLDAVCEQPQPIGLPDISVRVDMPRQTVHRILTQLEATGLIARDVQRDRFTVGHKLSQLSLAAITSANYGEPVRLILQGLVDEVQETCNIGIMRGLDVLYLERIECDWPLRLNLARGSLLPAHCSGSGKVLLAYMNPRTRRALLRSAKLASHTSKSITDPDALEEECGRIRTQEFALAEEEFFEGIISIGVPVLNANGQAMAALAMHGPSSRLSRETAISRLPLLRQTSEKLARAWGLLEES